MSDMAKKCEGDCKEHDENLMEVRVTGGLHDTTYTYCGNAVREDIREGFLVEILEVIR
jgi:hypothetical protein